MATLQLKVVLSLLKLVNGVKSLKMITTQGVVKNIGDYTQGALTLENLPIGLRETVLPQVMLEQQKRKGDEADDEEYVESMIKAHSQLVSLKTKKIELGGFVSLNRDGDMLQNTTKVLEAILPKAAGLEHLVLYDYSNFPSFDCPCSEDSIKVILRMENLKIIEFSRVQFKYVKLVCQNLKNLQCVRCIDDVLEFDEEEDIEADIQDFKTSFSRLKVFLFDKTSPPSFEEKLTQLCIQHLPNLEIFAEFAVNPAFCLFKKMVIPEETSAMRHLQTVPTTDDLPTAFPRVTHLYADCTQFQPEGTRDSILRFPSIESLNLYVEPGAASATTLDSFLDAYGANLHTLMIRSRHFPFYFKFKTIFDACPQLQKLEMWNVRNLVKEPIGMFAQLRELEWGLLGRCGQGEDYEIELTNILLAAPNLEKLSLAENSEYALSVEDLRKLTSLVVDKKILCKLTSIRLEIRLIPEYELNYDLLRALRDFVAVAAVRLPDLVEFYFLLFGHDSEDLDEILEIGLCSSEEEDLMKIAEHFEDCIGDSTIADFIRAINARKQQ